MTIKRSLHSGVGSTGLPLASWHQHVLLSIVAEHATPLSTTALARITGHSLGATAHHVRAMAKAGLLEWAGERRARGALQTFYVASESGRDALRRARAVALALLFGTPTPEERNWIAALDRLDDAACDKLEGIRVALRPEVLAVVHQAIGRGEA